MYCTIDDLKECIAELLEVSISKYKDLKNDEDLSRIGLDSMYAISLIILLEEKYDIEFSSEKLSFDCVNTLNKIRTIVNDALSEK